ncbi:MAG: hypothetical protein ACR2PZ_27835 [Pseudomonadales bacterium]
MAKPVPTIFMSELRLNPSVTGVEVNVTLLDSTETDSKINITTHLPNGDYRISDLLLRTFDQASEILHREADVQRASQK